MSYNHLRADDTSRIKIDVAIGVLVALRGCAPDQAFAELVRVVQRTGIGIGSIARALVDLAGGRSGSSAEYAEAFNAWGEHAGPGPACSGHRHPVTHGRGAELPTGIGGHPWQAVADQHASRFNRGDGCRHWSKRPTSRTVPPDATAESADHCDANKCGATGVGTAGTGTEHIRRCVRKLD